MRVASRITVAAFCAGTSLSAQDTTLTRLLIANRHPIAVTEGRIDGAGGRKLLADARDARFVLIGEEHGVAEIPQAIGALLRELRPAGFSTLAIEVSPLRGAELDAMARRGARGAGVGPSLDSMLTSWRTTIPFYPLAEERAMLRAAMERQDALPPMKLWGLDYEVSADRQWLAELVALAPPASRATVRAVHAMAEDGFARLLSRGDPSRLFAFSAPDSVFRQLRRAFGAQRAARARAIIDLLERSAQINRPFLEGRLYESNIDRSLFLRQNFARELHAATARGGRPRVVFKFGGSHMMRGLNYTHTLDLGTAATMAAEADGGVAYHLLMLGGSGSKSTRMNIQRAQYEPTGEAEVDGSMLRWLKAALPDAGGVLFDLRSVRVAFLRSGRSTLTPVQDRFLHAYDAIVVFGGSRPGTVVPLRTAP